MSGQKNPTTHTRVDKFAHSLKTLERNKIPLTNSLGAPLKGTVAALENGAIYDMYYADGQQWNQISGTGAWRNSGHYSGCR